MTHTHLTLQPRLDISTAPELYNDLKALYATATGPCTIDGSAVEIITTPALQLLLSFYKALTERAVSCHLASPSDAMLAALCTLGLDEPFNPWMTTHDEKSTDG